MYVVYNLCLNLNRGVIFENAHNIDCSKCEENFLTEETHEQHMKDRHGIDLTVDYLGRTATKRL